MLKNEELLENKPSNLMIRENTRMGVGIQGQGAKKSKAKILQAKIQDTKPSLSTKPLQTHLTSWVTQREYFRRFCNQLKLLFQNMYFWFLSGERKCIEQVMFRTVLVSLPFLNIHTN